LVTFDNSLRIAFIRSSNCPRYLVPATIEAISRLITRLSKSRRDTFFCTMRKANPSAIADLPTPGSPIRMGLFFLRRLRICANRSISFSRPTIGSRLFSSASRVMSIPKLSSTGVSVLGFEGFFCPPDAPCFFPKGSSESSSSFSGYSDFALGCL